MTENLSNKLLPSDNFSHSWPADYGWAVEQMPLPAFLCDWRGAVLKCNASAVDLWGGAPDPEEPGRWHGWEQVLDADGNLLGENPVARAIKRDAPVSMDVVVQARGNGAMRATIFSRPVRDRSGEVVGALCAVSVSGPADSSHAKERAAFLSILSHELRNPLSPIMSAAAVLRKTTSDPAAVKMVDIVDRQSKQLARFVTDLLDASRLHRSEEVPCEVCETHLSAVLDAALDPIGPILKSRGQTLSENVFNRFAKLRCDPARVAQALANILRNASSHSPDGAEITLKAYSDGDKLMLVVDDRGAGINAELAKRAAEPFVQGATPIGRAPSGAGLGLAIARSVCLAHGGVMTLDGGADGYGAHVELILPIVTSLPNA
ncbi:PAS domain-containing sensor histidine kinase [Massilia sp. 9096]|uniref:sensor histidine kinase n=1 Tax=Massilia sp. 9096 TaxID=1500894 RepID=UPI0009DD850F|nr:PAS domain-containing sensor histidine kinase [Massilia sp. 9096]